MSPCQRMPWSGVFPATMCPFREDFSMDEADLARYLGWAARHKGVMGVVVNGHTGEVASLRNTERARVCCSLPIRTTSGNRGFIPGTTGLWSRILLGRGP